jgi:hypothetical protein
MNEKVGNELGESEGDELGTAELVGALLGLLEGNMEGCVEIVGATVDLLDLFPFPSFIPCGLS